MKLNTRLVRALVCALTTCIYSESALSSEYAVTFENAYNDAFSQSNDIRAAEANIYGRKADKWQAGRKPNPILIIAGENIGQNIPGGANEVFISVMQPVELGGKRRAREKFADAVECESYWDLEVVKNDLSNAFLHAFIFTAAAQERVSLTQKQLEYAQDFLAHVKIKTESGKGSGLELKRAQLAYNNASIAIVQEKANLQQEIRRLKGFWSCPPEFTSVLFSIYEIEPLPSIEDLSRCLENNPILGKAQATSTKACRLIELERSQRFPTIGIQAGISTQEYVKNPTALVGLEIPLTIFDKNSGNIDSAYYDHTQALYQEQSAIQQIQTDLAVAYNEWATSFDDAERLKRESVPNAEDTHEFSKQGFLQGKFNYLEYLDSQRILLETQKQYLDAVELYHHKRADVLKLVMDCTTTN